jgi:hypothetical protein
MTNRFTSKQLFLPMLALIATMAVTSSLSAQQVITGTVAYGSLFEFDVPANWNGDLVVYAHGIFDPQAALVLPSRTPPVTFRWCFLNCSTAGMPWPHPAGRATATP